MDSIRRTEAEVKASDKQVKKAKKKDRRLDAEFMIQFERLVHELEIVAGHERRITEIRTRMQEIIKERDRA